MSNGWSWRGNDSAANVSPRSRRIVAISRRLFRSRRFQRGPSLHGHSPYFSGSASRPEGGRKRNVKPSPYAFYDERISQGSAAPNRDGLPVLRFGEWGVLSLDGKDSSSRRKNGIVSDPAWPETCVGASQIRIHRVYPAGGSADCRSKGSLNRGGRLSKKVKPEFSRHPIPRAESRERSCPFRRIQFPICRQAASGAPAFQQIQLRSVRIQAVPTVFLWVCLCLCPALKPATVRRPGGCESLQWSFPNGGECWSTTPGSCGRWRFLRRRRGGENRRGNRGRRWSFCARG